MPKMFFQIAAAIAATATIVFAQQPNTNIQNRTQFLSAFGLPDNIQGYTTFAILYGAPLNAWTKLFDNDEGLPILHNNLYTADNGQLADSTQTNVVLPNADTIYATAVYDLAEQDLEFTLPPMQADRYYVLAFYDPYGDNYASIGSVNASDVGKYKITQGFTPVGASTINNNSACTGNGEYVGCIASPTYDGTLLVRVEAKNNSSDPAYCDSWINQIMLQTVNQHPAPPGISNLSASDFQNLSNDATTRTLELVSRLADRNPPQLVDWRQFVPGTLASAGCSNGTFSPQPGANITAANQAANQQVVLFSKTPDFTYSLSNGWDVYNNSWVGSYEDGQGLLGKVYISEYAYLANTPDQSIYPRWDGGSEQSLKSNESYLLTFSGKPPISSDGFWSITMYDAQGFLVANAQDVYAVGDRSGLIYSNGSLVYGSDDHSSDGCDSVPFQILIQSTDVALPSNWTSNWLPAPSNESFTFTLRMYAPKDAATNNQYVYPTVEKQVAISC